MMQLRRPVLGTVHTGQRQYCAIRYSGFRALSCRSRNYEVPRLRSCLVPHRQEKRSNVLLCRGFSAEQTRLKQDESVEKTAEAAVIEDDDEPIISEKETIEKYWRTAEPDLYELREMEKKRQEEEMRQPHFIIRMGQYSISTIGWVIKGIMGIMLNPSRIPGLCNEAWVFLKHEFHHYKDGTKLLIADISTSARLLRKVSRGENLTRRQRRLLVRTASDVFRLVPFSVFVIVPGLEFALPFFLKLFPNMLPSQFVATHTKEEEMRKQLIARLNLAEFLQETVKDMVTKQIGGGRAKEAQDLMALLEKVRRGEHVTNAQLRDVAKLFKDDLTLDNMDRPHLVMMCKFLGLSPYAPSELLLRNRIRTHIEGIKMDDKVIAAEGIDNLTLHELRQASTERGMVSATLTEAGYKKNLKQWIDLSLNQKIPISLLILSRAFAVSERRPALEKSLKKTIASIEDDVVEEVIFAAGVADNKASLEMIERQQELIDEEEEDLLEHHEEKKITSETTELTQKLELVASQLSIMAQQSAVTEERLRLEQLTREAANQKRVQLREKLEQLEKELEAAAQSLVVEVDEPVMTDAKRPETIPVSTETAAKVPVEVVTSATPAAQVEPSSDRKEAETSNKAQQLASRVDSMIQRLNLDITDVDKSIGNRLNLLDLDQDGQLSTWELEEAVKTHFNVFTTEAETKEAVTQLKNLCEKSGKFFISVEDLKEVVKNIKASQRAEERPKKKKVLAEDVSPAPSIQESEKDKALAECTFEKEEPEQPESEKVRKHVKEEQGESDVIGRQK
eukprot:gb/GEZN01001527.1/.p1 GENE.gb/GEZN01001527.1/~~gb/GEZN01001527.1/.p1  ORF type:complete len:791 (-),score=154.83 gb/GEZN01001527.1/:492-2864(-)